MHVGCKRYYIGNFWKLNDKYVTICCTGRQTQKRIQTDSENIYLQWGNMEYKDWRSRNSKRNTKKHINHEPTMSIEQHLLDYRDHYMAEACQQYSAPYEQNMSKTCKIVSIGPGHKCWLCASKLSKVAIPILFFHGLFVVVVFLGVSFGVSDSLIIGFNVSWFQVYGFWICLYAFLCSLPVQQIAKTIKPFH